MQRCCSRHAGDQMYHTIDGYGWEETLHIQSFVTEDMCKRMPCHIRFKSQFPMSNSSGYCELRIRQKWQQLYRPPHIQHTHPCYTYTPHQTLLAYKNTQQPALELRCKLKCCLHIHCSVTMRCHPLLVRSLYVLTANRQQGLTTTMFCHTVAYARISIAAATCARLKPLLC